MDITSGASPGVLAVVFCVLLGLAVVLIFFSSRRCARLRNLSSGAVRCVLCYRSSCVSVYVSVDVDVDMSVYVDM
jgi:hypothetical protein